MDDDDDAPLMDDDDAPLMDDDDDWLILSATSTMSEMIGCPNMS
jgi:hypothetical protein